MSDAKYKRRRFRFSLRTLMIVVTLFTVTFGGWVQYRRHRAQQKREEVAAIRRSGGYQYVEIGPRTWLEEHFDEPTGRCWKILVVDFGKKKSWSGKYPPLLHLLDEKTQATDDGGEEPPQESPRCEILP